MANYRPKSLSELNTVYDKAMRAEKAIKEGSNLLSVPEKETTLPNENIFTQLENKASEAEKNQVFDPDITNIANDFLKRYAKPEKPKVAPKEVKRPAPSIQSVYHAPAKVRQEVKADVPMSTVNNSAPAVPLHKPAPTMPAVQPPVVREPEIVREAPAPQIIAAPEAPAVPVVPVVSAPVAAPKAEVAPEVPAPAVKAAPQAPEKRFAPRVRITSTERSELMEEYMRVMYDEDDDDDYSYKKPKFSFFKKKKKYEEEIDEEPALLYDEYDDGEYEDNFDDEIPVVPFDNSEVRYTDEYSDAPQEDIVSDNEMDVYDYIEADFDYDESEEDDDILDISFATTAKEEHEVVEETAMEEEALPEADEASEEAEVEIIAEEETEEAEEIAEAVDAIAETEEIAEEAVEAETEDSEEVVYPEEETEEEAEEVIYPDAPPADMIFEDIFSVSDETKRSHTGGNWEEVFGANFNANQAEEAEEEYAPVTYETEDGDYEEAPVEEYPDSEDYPEKAAEEEQYEEEIKQPKKQIFLKVLMLLTAFVCITAAAATVLVTSITAVNTGKIVSDRYRTFSVSENIESLGLSAGDLVITENVYAHTDDRYVYSTDGTYAFGIVSDSTTNELGDYLYETQTENDVVLVNRNNSMGVIVATYSGIGTILAIICDYYIFIAGALLILAVAMIVCFVIISKRKSYTEKLPEYDENDDIDDTDDHNDYEGPAETTEYDDDDTDNYYDYDTDGIEEGLFSDI